MKRIYLTMIFLMVISTFLFGENEEFLGLSPALYLPIAMVLSAVVGFFGKKLGPFGNVMRSLTKNFVTYDRVHKATELVLSQSAKLQPFATWVATLLAQLVTSIPSTASNAQVRDIISSEYSKLGPKKAQELIPTLPSDIAKYSFARKMVANAVLRKLNVGKGAAIPNVD